jgi:hypothetical protein
MRHAAFAALAASTAIAAQAGTKWVPLNSQQAKEVQGGAVAPAQPAAPAPAVAPAPSAADAAPPASTPQTQVAAAPVTDGSRPLELTCLGTGVASKATSAVAWGWGGWGVATGHKDRGFNDQVDLRLFTGDDRVRMPRTMLPGLHGGDHGWFKVHDLFADARAIRASAGVGMLNNPKIFIDRVTGTISISGKSGDYAGQCQVIDANAAPKF